MSAEGTARILLLSMADTELLAAKASGDSYTVANPSRLDGPRLEALLAAADVVVLRLLGGRRAWQEGLDAVLASGLPAVCLSGESTPDAELMALSTVPAGVAQQTLAYLREGGVDNLRELARFLSDTVHLIGVGFGPPQPVPQAGLYERGGSASAAAAEGGRPTIGVVFYRAHALSGNTSFIDALCDAIQRQGARARPVFCGSLRSSDGSQALDLLRGCDALVVTVLAAGGTTASTAVAGEDDETWDVGALAALDVPVVQGLVLTSSRAAWEESDAALTPLDAAMQVAIPEFDGRLISVPFSFKETVGSAEDSGNIPAYVADGERCARVAGIAAAYARLRHVSNDAKRLAVVLSSYPTKHSRVGNAVGLDTPASAVLLLRALAEAGYDLGNVDLDSLVGDTLIHRLIAAGGHDVEWLTEDQLRAAPARVPASVYAAQFVTLPAPLQTAMREAWGEPPGRLYVDESGAEPTIVLAALRLGNVLLMIQPPRGFGENPIAIYHDPDLPPSHHYLAAYRWLETSQDDGGFGADAVVHLGKHGTLEWLPGKGLGLSADCAPDAVLGNLPLVYPFIVNDPGEGTQAKRRAHATVVDHLVPPMARAESYGDIAKLEQLLDEYATVAALDPAKVPTVRAQIWQLVQAAQLHADLHVDAQPGEEEFDDFVLHLDGYLCEIKDVLIRDGLHVLGAPPEGEALDNLALSVLRAAQVWGGRGGALPGLRTAVGKAVGMSEELLLADPGAVVDAPVQLGIGEHVRASAVLDAVDEVALTLVRRLRTRAAGESAEMVVADVLGAPDADVAAVLQFAEAELFPRLARTTDEIAHVLHALDGGYVPAGPSGSPTRGLVNVLPTGRNFYSVDPKAIPSRNAWEVGQALADSLLRRHREDTGNWPRSVGLTVWGTSAMRTQGDDIAEILALLGCRPTWDDASRRVTGFEVLPLEELARPRIDVTVRISGFFRDAFPHVVGLVDDAVRTVAALDEPAERNFVRAHYLADLADLAHLADPGDERRASTRIFGSKPGAYGAGLLPLIDARNWRTDEDLAEVYAVWGGYAYGRGLDGREARGELERTYSRIAVAAKNQDTREHDIVDSDDYFQYHGGMVTMVRSLTGVSPAAYVGDSAVPESVRTRTLGEETARVFRARVVNPKWVSAMRRHGYKGAFEMAATVDYLFGYDATAGVVPDWMYESLASTYVFDDENRAFLEQSNPWALRGMTERLLEAADRGLWESPGESTLARLRQAYLDSEGDLEGDAP